jgi:GPH family glycoside/pentoside/hexuronide:cation symporter/probable glucitol transport protein GutA
MFTGSYLSLFFVKVFGIPTGAVATMLLVLGIWDTINDPIMGGIVDKTHTRYGKLRPWLLFVPIPLAISTILFWGGPLLLRNTRELTVKIVYMYLSYLLWEFFYTLGDVPYWSLSAALSPSPSDRTRAIATARFLSGLIGGAATVVMLPVMIDLSNNGKIAWSLKEVFAFCGAVSAVFIVGLFSLAGLFVKERVVQQVEETSFFDAFRFLGKNKPLLLIILSNALGTISAVAGVFGAFYYTEVLNLMSWSSVISVIGGLGGLFGMMSVAAVKRRYDNRQMAIINKVVPAALGTVAFFCGMRHYDIWYVVIPIIGVKNLLCGVFDAYNSVVSTEMIGDTVDYMEWKTGMRNEGMAFSVLTFVGKMQGRLSTSLGTALLPVIGYYVTETVLADGTVETVSNCTQAFGQPTQFWLWAFFTIIPAVTGLLGIIPYHFYELKGGRLAEIREEMRQRREALAAEAPMGGVTDERR